MGVILRQSAKATGIKVIATVIGMVSMLFIYPLDHKSYGTVQFIVSVALLILPFASFGIPHLIVKFFTDYKADSKDVRSMLPTMMIFLIGVSSFFCVLYLLFSQYIYSLLSRAGFEEALLTANQYWILGIMVLMLIMHSLNSYISNFGRIVIPAIILDLGYKLFLPSIIILIYIGIFSDNIIAPSLLVFYGLAILLSLLYIQSLGAISWKPDFSYFNNREKRNEFITYGLFSSMTSLGAMMAFRLDSVMITTLLDAEKNGLYFNVFLMANVIDLPGQAISKIASPVISKSWTNNDTKEISSIYKKSSLLNQIIGTLIFLGLWVNLEHLFAVSSKPEAFIGASTLFVVLGLAKLFDAMTGLNSQILAYSSAYKYNLIFLLFLGALSVGTNYYFIPEYGVLGAGIATFISLIIFNVLKLGYLKYKFDMNPLSKETFIVLFLGVASAGIIFLVPTYSNHLIAMALKSLMVLVIFLLPIYYFKISPDINSAIQLYVIDRFKGKKTT